MATYYVDLDQVGVGDGSSGSPYNLTQMLTITELGSGSDIFKLRGSRSSPETSYAFSSLGAGVSFIFKAWDLIQYGPWRLNCSNFTVGLDGSGISDGIIYTVYSISFNIWNGTITNMFCHTSSEQILTTQAIISGCTFITPTLSKAGNNTLNDCVLDLVNDADESFIYNNCVFSRSSMSGTLNNCQVSWTPPTWPAWDGTDFTKSTLGYGTIESGAGKPRPGIGYPSYTGYAEDLIGALRDDIGAYASEALPPAPTTTTPAPTTTTPAPTTTTPAPTTTTTTTPAPTTTPVPTGTYYVNINSIYDGSGPHAGTNVDPFDYAEFVAKAISEGDIFKIQGSRDLGSNDITKGIDGSGPSFYLNAWDLTLFGPWRIKTTGKISLFTGNDNPANGGVSDAILQSDSAEYLSIYIQGNISNSFCKVPTGGASNVQLHSNTVAKGCTFVGRIPSVYSSSVINDCIVSTEQMDFGQSPTWNNCVFKKSSIPGTTSNCQVSWTPPTWPAWNGTDFTKSTLGYGTIESGEGKPRPGIGYPSYTGYAEDLIGALRDDIGAYASGDFPAPTTTTPAPTTTTPAPTTTTPAPTTTTPAPTTTTPAPTTTTTTTTTTPAPIVRLSYFIVASASDNTSVTSTIDSSALISRVQSVYPGDLYFDTTSEVGPVYVYYNHSAGRQQKKLVHDSVNHQASVQWSSYAQDGTWEKTKIKAFDKDGAFVYLYRSDIGTGEDLTHSDGTIYLNT